jgi:hypothetical protein
MRIHEDPTGVALGRDSLSILQQFRKSGVG